VQGRRKVDATIAWLEQGAEGSLKQQVYFYKKKYKAEIPKLLKFERSNRTIAPPAMTRATST
jgi:hypothetical protein